MNSRYNPDWQKQYEEQLSNNYKCSITGHDCTNCSPYGCEHRKPKNVSASADKL